MACSLIPPDQWNVELENGVPTAPPKIDTRSFTEWKHNDLDNLLIREMASAPTAKEQIGKQPMTPLNRSPRPGSDHAPRRLSPLGVSEGSIAAATLSSAGFVNHRTPLSSLLSQPPPTVPTSKP